MKIKLLYLLFVCLVAGQAHAGLILNIYEDGSNNVVFDFSGSDTVTQGAVTYIRNGFWFGDITDQIYGGAAAGYTPISDTFLAQNMTQGTSSTLNDIYLNGGIGHELGIRLDNWIILTTASAGDVISWSGQAILNLDFSDFLSDVWTGTSLNAAGTDELILREGYTITIGATAVPAPGTLLLLVIGLGALGLATRRRVS